MFQELGSMRHGCCTLVWIMGTEMFLAKNLTTHDIFLSDKYGHQGGLKPLKILITEDKIYLLQTCAIL